jgi:hypothetical protein
MLGGIDNALFLQSLGGFFAVAILILFLKWAFPTKKDPLDLQRRMENKESKRKLRHK